MEQSNQVQSTDNAGKLPALRGEKPDVPNSCCKVQRVTEAYHLPGIDEELRRRYENQDATLHELANYINDRITAVTLDAINDPIDIEPATVRSALNGEDSVPAMERDNIRASLAGQLNIDLLTDAYVSHETVRRHLNEHLEVSTSRGGFETFEELEEALESYQDQFESGVSSALKRAGQKELIQGTSYRVFSTRVECGHCSETYRLQELLQNGGCDCRND